MVNKFKIKFEIGDLVERIKPSSSSYINVGEKYTVTGIYKHMIRLQDCPNPMNRNSDWDRSNFKLIKRSVRTHELWI